MSEQPFYKLYGHLDILADYLRIPIGKIRKVCKWDHGWTPLDKPLVKEITSPVNIILVWNKRRKQIIESQTNKKAFITGVPFIHWRKQKGLKKLKDAKGSVFFAAHSSQQTKIEYNVADLQGHIQSLPETYRPTAICLYWLDMERGYKQVYEKLGYEVVTAGDPYDAEFADRLYDILCRFEYCSSNSFGTYALYALDLDIPFFLIGEKPKLINDGDPNASIIRGKQSLEIKERIESLFRYEGGEITITKNQLDFFLEESGENDKDLSNRIRWWIKYFWIKKRIKSMLRSGR